MNYSQTLSKVQKKWLKKARRHQALLVVLFFLSVVAASSRYFLGASLLGGLVSGGNSSSSSSTNPRACTTVGTVFEDLETLKESTDKFTENVSTVVGEREEYFKQPSQWSCLDESQGGSGPAIDKLKALAELLPGWHYTSALGGTKLRPVTFESFTSILGEFQREYECKLDELARSSDSLVGRNLDLDNPKLYCCSDLNLCVHVDSDTHCSTTQSDDETCGGSCKTGNTHEVFAVRLGFFLTRLENEKQRARTAMLRTVHVLRSLELNYAYALQLTCFQRASLDLKNELSLLADATSCMPKIWDALTSVHDRDHSLP